MSDRLPVYFPPLNFPNRCYDCNRVLSRFRQTEKRCIICADRRKDQIRRLILAGWLVLCTIFLVKSVFASGQSAVMVWGDSCITSVERGIGTRIEAPMVDGKPDMKRALLYGVHASYIPECGQIQIRKEN